MTYGCAATHTAVLKAWNKPIAPFRFTWPISACLRSDGTAHGMAAFDRASELAQCHLRLPAGMRPLQVTASGLLAAGYVDQNRWLITPIPTIAPAH